MKLVVLIPCFNEAKTIGQVIERIPKKIPGINTIEVLVVDDGSTDGSAKIAKKFKAEIVAHRKNEGLGVAFRTGIETALKLKADIIVNIDGDLQFDPQDIPQLVRPIIDGQADMVTATRFSDPAMVPENMSKAKKIGNLGFTKLISFLTGQKFTDTQCGFRAYSREAALRLTLFGKFTYTQEVFLDLINKGMKIVEVPIKVKYFKERKSAISGSLAKYGLRALVIIIRAFRDYKPLVFFGSFGLTIFGMGFLLSLFSLIYWIILHQTSPIRMYLFTGVFLLTFGFLMIMLGLIADMFKRLKQTQEAILYKIKTLNNE